MMTVRGRRSPLQSNEEDATCSCGRYNAATTCSRFVGQEEKCGWEAPVGGGAGVFSNGGPTDAGDECIREPVHCCRECGPVDFAVLSVPVVSGIQLSAVAEAMDLVDDTLIVHTHEHQSSGGEDPRRPPGIVDRHVTYISALEPLEHSVLEEELDKEPLKELSIPEPLEHSVPVET